MYSQDCHKSLKASLPFSPTLDCLFTFPLLVDLFNGLLVVSGRASCNVNVGFHLVVVQINTLKMWGLSSTIVTTDAIKGRFEKNHYPRIS